MTQTILGSGGAIGIPLAKELRRYTDRVRLVARNPVKTDPADELVPADLTDSRQVDAAVAGSSMVYVTVGFPYRTAVWQKTWPPFMRSVLDACNRHGAKLVFFDNVYMYAKSSVPFMTEEAVIDPPSRKGEVRKIVRGMLLQDAEQGKVTALIARAADFYGPDNRNSILGIMVADNLRKGKKAQVFGDPGKIHTYTFTPDAARATALLGNTPDAYGREWHLPTTQERLTQMDWIRMIARQLGREPDVQRVPVPLIRLLGLFLPVMREFPEMIYQNESDYIFDSSRFEKRFGIRATPPGEGIRLSFPV